MNEPEFERSLGEWMRTGRTSASAWVLESVIEHAHQQPNRSWWARLRNAWSAGASTAPTRRRHIVGLTAVAATATAVLVALPFVMTAPWPPQDEAPAVAPASVAPATSPITTAASPAPIVQVGFPEGALTGSVWLEQAEGAADHYITLHPDGTLVERIKDLGSPIGIGLWEPDGQGGIASVIFYTDADPERHQVRGLSTYRADWTLDEPAESAQPELDGEPPVDRRGEPAGRERALQPCPAAPSRPAAGGYPRPPGRAGLGADPGSYGHGRRLGQRGRTRALRKRVRGP